MGQVRRRTAVAVAVAVLAVFAACGDDDDAADPVEGATTTTTTAEAAGPLPDACGLVADVGALVGRTVPPGAPAGNELRSSCAYPATGSGGLGITIAVEGGGRFDEKAARSTDILDDPGEDVDGVGDRARFFFADETPAAIGGLLVGVGDLTVEITLQGLADRDELREAALALGEEAAAALG